VTLSALPSNPEFYKGRFAPSPTGPLHFGSLVTAAASYLDARAHHGQWIVRMEDLDTPRMAPGAADDILRTLARFGLQSDEEVVFQSCRTALYQAALEALKAKGAAFPCSCTRRSISDGGAYPGTCRAGLAGRTARAWRVRVNDSPVCFIDRLQGEHCESLEEETGDFVVLRADGLFAYQLAVVVDDEAQGVTDVVRGADLLDSTPRQIFLQQQMDFACSRYLHLPVAVNESGQKLSKQTLAPAMNGDSAITRIRDVLRFLGQPEPKTKSLPGLWREAADNWNPFLIPAVLSAPAPPDYV
jgi:glutamyl-Q tRNA(Asp) synthetase